MISSLGFIFAFAGYSVATWSVGSLSNWDVSKITSLKGMFKNYGSGANTIVLDLSGWNISSVTDMTDMFFSAGMNAITCSVKIPKNTGSLSSTTDKFYGSSDSVYASPPSGKSFTLAN